LRPSARIRKQRRLLKVSNWEKKLHKRDNMKSTHEVKIVPIVLETHPNADELSIVRIDGYQVVVRTEEWKDRKIGAHVLPDTIVDVSRPEFSFLASRGDVKDGKLRIRACKFRGVVSFGLLVPCEGNIGDNLADSLGVEHYEPELKLCSGGDNMAGPSGVNVSKYDIETARKYQGLFLKNEPVFITEKIHGANARYVCVNEEMFCGSRTGWKQAGNNIWWKALTPEMEKFCRYNPGVILYGEVYGQVQNLKYGKKGVEFAAFDILDKFGFVNVALFLGLCGLAGIPTVPIIHRYFPYNWEEIEKMSNGPSLVPGANHTREGVVIKPLQERHTDEVGRLILKVVGSDYLEKK